MLVLTNIKDTRNGPTVQLPNNAIMNVKKRDHPTIKNYKAYMQRRHTFLMGYIVPSLYP